VLGAGMARVDSARSYSRFGSDFDHHGNDSNSFQGRNNMNNSFFVVQPGLRVEANLSRFAKLYAGVNYRIATGSSSVTYPLGATTSSLTNTQLSGVNFNIGLKLGWFDYKVKKKAQS
jgi:hypothetical protein